MERVCHLKEGICFGSFRYPKKRSFREKCSIWILRHFTQFQTWNVVDENVEPLKHWSVVPQLRHFFDEAEKSIDSKDCLPRQWNIEFVKSLFLIQREVINSCSNEQNEIEIQKNNCKISQHTFKIWSVSSLWSVVQSIFNLCNDFENVGIRKYN
jgi:hypothetical protein